ncbi:MAG: phosphodiesterase [Gammaproteobacteria bacterium]|nr:phosphodiesterase [Gammaproteobacteria bacterium]
MLIAQLTDPHIKAEGRLAYRRVDTAENLRRCVAHILALTKRPDLVLMTGDLTDFGRAEEYALLRKLLAPLDMPVYVIPGNHDTRDGMRLAFADGGYLPASGTLDYGVDFGRLRVLALDSVVPRKPHGELRPAQVDWLVGELEALGDRPAMVLLHHPPFDTGIVHMDVQRLLNAEVLIETLAGRRNVLLVACGHVHRSISTTVAGIPMLIAPSPSHAVALDHREGSTPGYRMEPGAVMLHVWRDDPSGGPGTLLSEQSFVDRFEGPYPFFNPDGTLID